MNYERYTEKGEFPSPKKEDLFCAECCNNDEFNGCEIGGCDQWFEYLEVYKRLCKLEDKIESGELISTKETGDTEIEFFVKHNKEARTQTYKEIYEWFLSHARCSAEYELISLFRRTFIKEANND